MDLFVSQFHWILYVTGALTATMFLMALAPVPQFKRYFGSELTDPNAVMIARHWGVIVGIIGLALIYAGYDPGVRTPVLWIAIAGKAAIVTLIALRLGALKGTGATQIVLADTIMVALYVTYLVVA